MGKIAGRGDVQNRIAGLQISVIRITIVKYLSNLVLGCLKTPNERRPRICPPSLKTVLLIKKQMVSNLVGGN